MDVWAKSEARGCESLTTTRVESRGGGPVDAGIGCRHEPCLEKAIRQLRFCPQSRAGGGNGGGGGGKGGAGHAAVQHARQGGTREVEVEQGPGGFSNSRSDDDQRKWGAGMR